MYGVPNTLYDNKNVQYSDAAMIKIYIYTKRVGKTTELGFRRILGH